MSSKHLRLTAWALAFPLLAAVSLQAHSGLFLNTPAPGREASPASTTVAPVATPQRGEQAQEQCGHVADQDQEDPNSKTQGGWPKLVEAAYRGDSADVKRLIDLGATIDRPGPEGWTALMQAAGNGHIEVVSLLLDAGAFINTENSAQKNAYDLADERGYTEVAELLYQQGAADDELRYFIYLALNGSEKLRHEMIDRGFDPNRTDHKGRSALFYAVAGDRRHRYHQMSFKVRPNIIKRLLENGADPNLRDRTGKTPLYAMKTEYGLPENALNLLLEYGADLMARDNAGKSLLCHAVGPAFLQKLLDAGADINQPDNEGLTPLHWQVQRGAAKTVALFLEHGADPEQEAKDGKKPVDMLRLNPERQPNEAQQQIMELLGGSAGSE